MVDIIGRARVRTCRLAAALGAALAPLVLGAGAQAGDAQQDAAGSGSRSATVRLTYLGTAGWEITDGRAIVLIDPSLRPPAAVGVRELGGDARRHPARAAWPPRLMFGRQGRAAAAAQRPRS